MPTQRYRLPASGSAAVSPAFQSYTHSQGTRRPLPTSDATALATQAYTPDAADHGVAGDAAHVQFVSAALASGLTFASGQVFEFCVQCLEAHANNNLNVQVWIGIYSNDGSTLLATLRSKVEQTAEVNTVLESRYFTGTLSGSYGPTGGTERLVVEFALEGTPGGGGGVQGHNGSIRWGADGAGGDLAENDTQTGTTLNPWIEFNPTEAVSGTAASTQPPSASAATGTLRFSGTVASAQPAAASAATGSLVFSGTVASVQPPAASAGTGTIEEIFVGTVASTQPPASTTSTGALVFSGSAASSQPAAASAGTALLVFQGTGTSTQPAAASAATGSVVFSGTVASAQPPAASAAIGAEVFIATAASAQPPATSTASGSLAFSATVTSVQPPAASSATGLLMFTGAVASLQPPATSSGTGTIPSDINGTVASLRPPAFTTATGTSGPTTGLPGIHLGLIKMGGVSGGPVAGGIKGGKITRGEIRT